MRHWNALDKFKTVTGSLPWTDKTEWQYPVNDAPGRNDWMFEQGPVDIDPSMEVILPMLRGQRTCIQAGGFVGIWPTRLIQLFDRVISFEPDPINYRCLVRNTIDLDGLETIHGALGKEAGRMIHMEVPPRYTGNQAAGQVMPGGDTKTVVIDDLELDDVDLIYLDIEGSEYDAIMGAKKTIQRCRPVIGMEDKKMHSRYNNGASPVDLVESFGYRVLCKPIKSDIVLVPA